MSPVTIPILHMSCGCILKKTDLVIYNHILHCPKHPTTGKIIMIEKYCVRCGHKMFLKPLSHKKIFCDNCHDEINLSRTIYLTHRADEYTDLILWKKTFEKAIEDCAWNAYFGYEAIQTDSCRTVQKNNERIIINFKKKNKILRKRLA